jgi:glycosyltransferase involved in cell wall biosynthesis
MTKVAVVTAHFPSLERPTDGRSAYQTLRTLSLQTAVRVFYPSATYPSLLKRKNASCRSCNTSFNPPNGVEVDYYDYPALPFISRPFNGWIAAHALADHVRAFAPDLIMSYFLYPDAFAALQIGKALSIPVIAWGVGSDVHNIGDRISAMHTRSVLREADFLVMVSSDLRERAITMGAAPERALTILNGCDLSVFHVADRLDARTKLHIDPWSKAVVYVGRMDLKKGLRELVDSAAMLHPEIPDLQVYLVGEGPDKHAIESLIRSNDAAGYVHAMPPCTFNEVAVWMAAADVVTLPSYMEGCPNVVLEALACGRPVVATNVGGIPEIMNNDYGELVPPRDTPALARALASVLDRTWDAEAISAHCSRGWSDVASELLTIIQSLVSTRKAAAHVP